MTTKEKAEELINKYIRYFDISNPFSPYDTNRECKNAKDNYKNAKQCALIAADEFIEDFGFISEFDTDRLSFWEEVKQEILKL